MKCGNYILMLEVPLSSWMSPTPSSYSSWWRSLFMIIYSSWFSQFLWSSNFCRNNNHSSLVTSSLLIPYTSSVPPTPTELPLSPGVCSMGTPDGFRARTSLSTIFTNASSLGETKILVTYDSPRYRALVKESTLVNNSSMNLFIPKPGLQSRPLPPSKLVFWGVLGLSRWFLQIFMKTYESCNIINHTWSLG